MADVVDVDGLLIGPGERIRDHVGLSFKVSDICGKFTDAGQLIGLSNSLRVRFFSHARDQTLMVGKQGEWASLEHVAEVSDRFEGAEELTVVRRP